VLAGIALVLANAAPLPAATAKPGRDTRIIGGNNAARGAWPFVAALVYADTANTYQAQFCAGTLIHPQWVATAAHCVVDLIPTELQVIIGAYDLNEGGTRISVVDIIIHPDYDAVTSDSDIALLLLDRPVGMPAIDLVADDTSQADQGTFATILGWGDTTNGGGIYPSILQQGQVPIVSNAVANQPSIHAGAVTPRMVAAGYINGGIDTCGGDSGGPLLVATPEGGWLLAGITSWGTGCGDPNSFGVYTRSSSFRPWVREFVHPGYGQWEADAGLALPTDPHGGDGSSALLAYAMTADPGEPLGSRGPRAGTVSHSGKTYPTITVPRWRGDATVQWWIEESQTVRNWQVVDPAARQVGVAVPLDPQREEVTFRGGFALEDHPGAQLRLRPRLNDAFAAGAIRWTGLDFRYSRLHALLPADPARTSGTFRYREFLLSGLPAGESVLLSTRARDFTTFLRLENATTGAAVSTQSQASGAATDLVVAFTPQAGQLYRLIASSTVSQASGALRVAAFQASTEPLLTVGAGTTSGALSSSSYRAEFGDYSFYYNLYRLNWSGSPTALNVTARSSAIDTYVEILDPETFETLWLDDDNGGGFDSSARFATGHPPGYLVLVSSAVPDQTGAYTVTATTDTITTLSANNSFVSFTLSTSSRHHPDLYAAEFLEYYVDERLLAPLAAGTVVEIDLQEDSSGLDTYLYVYDAHNGQLVTENDDAPGGTNFNSQVRLTVRPNTRYLIRSTTYDPAATGNLRIRARVVP